MRKGAEEKRFEQIIDDLKEWLRKRCAPKEAVSVMGAVSASLIWHYSDNNHEALGEAYDFCTRIMQHVEVLNETSEDTRHEEEEWLQ